MRITGGIARGRIINAPAGLEVRPTASKIRQAFFNILRNMVCDASVLDLCAGSGLMGIEALSRGAASLIAVEEKRSLAKAIESNLERLSLPGKVICADVRRVLPALEPASFDIIFADPPYASRLCQSILSDVEKYRLLGGSGVLAIEHAEDNAPVPAGGGLVLFDRRQYGRTAVSFYRRVQPG